MGTELIIGWIAKVFIGWIAKPVITAASRHWKVAAILITATTFVVNTGHAIRNKFENRRIAAKHYQMGLADCKTGGGSWWGRFRRRWTRGDIPETMTEAEFLSIEEPTPWYAPVLEFHYPVNEDDQ